MSIVHGLDASGCVLEDAERESALRDVRQFAAMARVSGLPVPSGCLADLAARCAAAVLQMRAPRDTASIGFDGRFDRLGCEAVALGDSRVLVTGHRGQDDRLTPRFIADVARPLGGESGQDASMPGLREHADQLQAAAALLPPWSAGVVQRNSGLIVPFPCLVPKSGSGTSRTLPGVLLLPTGVPAPLYAECWLHECLHTELILAEWMTGGDLASAPEPLPTPWRTVDRPANLLLHGAFVFVSVARFMRNRAEAYGRMPPTWRLSAAKGRTVRACDADEAANFRITQVREAMRTLHERATFTPFGRRVESAVLSGLSALGG